jgi:hypothetical protein
MKVSILIGMLVTLFCFEAADLEILYLLIALHIVSVQFHEHWSIQGWYKCSAGWV